MSCAVELRDAQGVTVHRAPYRTTWRARRAHEVISGQLTGCTPRLSVIGDDHADGYFVLRGAIVAAVLIVPAAEPVTDTYRKDHQALAAADP